MYLKLAVFVVLFVLYFYENTPAFAQSTDNSLVIDYSATEFSIERPFTITLIIHNSDTRPTLSFPDVPGLAKQGLSTSATRNEAGEVVSQYIVQTYLATRPGSIQVAPFTLTVNGQSVRSPGVTLTVRAAVPTAEAAALARLVNDRQAIFLQTTVSQPVLYTGEGLRIQLSFFVAENYPYEVRFEQLEQQVAAIMRTLRPVNAWEENNNITELTPQPTTLNGRRYVEYRLYQATFFPLATRNGAARQINLPAVPLRVTRRMVAPPVPPVSASGPASRSAVAAKTDAITFYSQPVRVEVRPLPIPVSASAPVQMSVGTFRLTTDISRLRVSVGQSVRCDIRIEGQGNIAGIQPPQMAVSSEEADVFPPQIQEQISRNNGQVSGYKSFRYFLIPKRKGDLLLIDRFFWVYFNPQSKHYDTLRPAVVLHVGEASDGPTPGIIPSDTLDGNGHTSIYAGLEQLDSSQNSINWPVLIRATANVLIILMILGTLFVFTRK